MAKIKATDKAIANWHRDGFLFIVGKPSSGDNAAEKAKLASAERLLASSKGWATNLSKTYRKTAKNVPLAGGFVAPVGAEETRSDCRPQQAVWRRHIHQYVDVPLSPSIVGHSSDEGSSDNDDERVKLTTKLKNALKCKPWRNLNLLEKRKVRQRQRQCSK